MTDAASIPQEDAPDVAFALSVRRAEWRLALLEELTEIGMEMARALRAGVASQQSDGVEGSAKGRTKDPAEVFAQLSRAIRLTLSLHAKTDEELRDLRAGVVRAREEESTRRAERARAAAKEEQAAREKRVYLAVLEAATVEIPEVEQLHQLMEALDERLEQDDAYWQYGKRPARETFERLCHDLGLDPHLSHWDGDERIEAFPPTRPLFSPFRKPSRRPVLGEDDAAGSAATNSHTPNPPQVAHVLE
jgi:hypothetical protein